MRAITVYMEGVDIKITQTKEVNYASVQDSEGINIVFDR